MIIYAWTNHATEISSYAADFPAKVYCTLCCHVILFTSIVASVMTIPYFKGWLLHAAGWSSSLDTLPSDDASSWREGWWRCCFTLLLTDSNTSSWWAGEAGHLICLRASLEVEGLPSGEASLSRCWLSWVFTVWVRSSHMDIMLSIVCTRESIGTGTRPFGGLLHLLFWLGRQSEWPEIWQLASKLLTRGLSDFNRRKLVSKDEVVLVMK